MYLTTFVFCQNALVSERASVAVVACHYSAVAAKAAACVCLLGTYYSHQMPGRADKRALVRRKPEREFVILTRLYRASGGLSIIVGIFDRTTVRDGVLKPVDMDSNFAIKF